MNAGNESTPEHGPDAQDERYEQALEIARDALRHEAATISIVADQLDESFIRTLDHILSSEGRVVVTGLGKSGLVGRKIAATLASTGTPAYFVHAVEAHHGDAGMVVPGDVMIAISNSGETQEVIDLTRLVRKRGVVVIAFTGMRESSLGREADECLYCGAEREADPLNLAPTASTAAAMAMGDALGIGLMVLSGFDAAAFLLNHPHGSLGAGARPSGPVERDSTDAD